MWYIIQTMPISFYEKVLDWFLLLWSTIHVVKVSSNEKKTHSKTNFNCTPFKWQILREYLLIIEEYATLRNILKLILNIRDKSIHCNENQVEKLQLYQRQTFFTGSLKLFAGLSVLCQGQ